MLNLDGPISIFLAAIIAGFALIGLTLLLDTLLAPFITVIHIIAAIVIVLFALAIIFRALYILFTSLG